MEVNDLLNTAVRTPEEEEVLFSIRFLSSFLSFLSFSFPVSVARPNFFF